MGALLRFLARYGGKISAGLAGSQIKDAWDWAFGDDSDEAKVTRTSYAGFFVSLLAAAGATAFFLLKGKKKRR
jgi:hypothetical protein